MAPRSNTNHLKLTRVVKERINRTGAQCDQQRYLHLPAVKEPRCERCCMPALADSGIKSGSFRTVVVIEISSQIDRKDEKPKHSIMLTVRAHTSIS